MDADGTATGFDTELIQAVRAAVDVPLIASGGAGRAPTSAPPLTQAPTRCWPRPCSTSAQLRIGEVKDALRAAGHVVR